MLVIHGCHQEQFGKQIPVNPFCGRQDRKRHRPRRRASFPAQRQQRPQHLGGFEFHSVDCKHNPPDYACGGKTLKKMYAGTIKKSQIVL